MILESVKSAPAKVIHVFDLGNCDGKDNKLSSELKKNEFRIGRSIESDMKIADISVSRVHSFIKFEGDQLILIDNFSKFGTMVKIMKPYPIIQVSIPFEHLNNEQKR